MGHIMSRPIKRLSNLEIDEVSLVDVPANQHGLVAIAKRAEGNDMAIFDANGDEVTLDDLEHGEDVFDEHGEWVARFAAAGTPEYEAAIEAEAELYDEDVDDEDQAEMEYGVEERELVGKANFIAGAGGTVRGAGKALERVGPSGRGRRAANAVETSFRRGGARARRAGQQYGRGAALVTGGAGAGYAGGRVKKSLGQDVYESLSKALSADDQANVIAKALDEVSKAQRDNDLLRDTVEKMAWREEMAEYTEIAKSYNLPGDPTRLARILKSAVDTMAPADVEELDRLLVAQGSLYDEIGASGALQSSEIMGQVEEMALGAVGKAAGSLSEAQAVVGIFEANPAAYDEYLAESR